MDRTQKESFVKELRERIDRAPVMYLTDFTGLDVKAMNKLRRSLKGSGAEYVVVKNRLAKLAFAETEEFPDISESLEGPTGLVFGYEDAVSAAKTLSDFAKEHDQKPAFKLGVMDRQVLEPEQGLFQDPVAAAVGLEGIVGINTAVPQAPARETDVELLS